MVRFLNQSGTRIVTDEKILVTGIHNGKTYHRMRKPMFWEQFGNFAVVNVRVGDKVFRGFPDKNDDGIPTLNIMTCWRLK
jgi:hypothetical protein